MSLHAFAQDEDGVARRAYSPSLAPPLVDRDVGVRMTTLGAAAPSALCRIGRGGRLRTADRANAESGGRTAARCGPVGARARCARRVRGPSPGCARSADRQNGPRPTPPRSRRARPPPSKSRCVGWPRRAKTCGAGAHCRRRALDQPERVGRHIEAPLWITRRRRPRGRRAASVRYPVNP